VDTLHISSVLVTAAVAAFIPWLTALVTAQHAPSALKAGLTLLLTATSGILVSVQADPGYDWQHAALYAVEGFAVAVMSHLGAWKPFGVTGSAGAIQTAIPKGLGRTS
jgi:hypothetical protein